MVGLSYLKHVHDVSDEEVVEGWVDNPYWQYFCGEEFFRHDTPIDPSLMTRWRGHIGPMERLLAVAPALKRGVTKTLSLKRLSVDTTVQEKAIAHPTDSRLHHKAREKLVAEAKKADIPLRQSYTRLSKRAAVKAGRYAQGKDAGQKNSPLSVGI